jgi:hypothetical protein
MALQRINTIPYPLVTQQSDLDGVTYSMRFRWSERSSVWHLDLRTLDDVPIVLSAALVTAWPLLERVVSPIRPPGELVLLDLAGPAEPATLEGFGERWVLFYAEAVAA